MTSTTKVAPALGAFAPESNEQGTQRSSLGRRGSRSPEPASNPFETQKSGGASDQKRYPRNRHRAPALWFRLLPALVIHLGHSSLAIETFAVTAIVGLRFIVRRAGVNSNIVAHPVRVRGSERDPSLHRRGD